MIFTIIREEGKWPLFIDQLLAQKIMAKDFVFFFSKIVSFINILFVRLLCFELVKVSYFDLF